MHKQSPLVSILMPVYNGAKYLADAIESILNQSLTNYELIIINDGSTDETSAILDHYSDSRIIYVTHQHNQGLVKTLNQGLRLARGYYIARMDADDISLPKRLERQVQFLEQHPHIGILGTQVMYIDPQGRPLSRSFNPTQPHLLPWHLLFSNCISHPSVMVRRAIYDHLDGYNLVSLHVEDYDLWLRAMFVTQMANLDEIYLQYRVHPTSVSHTYRATQDYHVALVLQKIYRKLLVREDVLLETVQALISLKEQRLTSEEDRQLSALLVQLYRAYIQSNDLSTYEQKALTIALVQKAWALVAKNRFAPSLFQSLSRDLNTNLPQGVGPYLGQAIRQSGQAWLHLQFWWLYCRAYLRFRPASLQPPR